MVTIPRSKGKANYKVDVLILVVEEKLPNGAQAWQEVAAIYQAWSGEMLLQDHNDIKRHWVDKCCNKFKKPTGTPGDPKRDMILRCQRIHKWILKKSSSCIMGADLEGDKGLDLSEGSEVSEEGEDDDEANEDVLGDGDGVAVAGGLMAAEKAVVEELAGGFGGPNRNTTPTNLVDVEGDGSIGILAPDELAIAPVPPLQSTMQQSAKGAVYNAPLLITQQSAEGATNAPLYQPRYGQAFLTPELTTHPQQQLYLHRDFTASGHGTFVPLQQRAAVPPGTVPAQQQPAVLQTSVVATQQQPAGQQPGVNPPNLLLSNQPRKRGKKVLSLYLMKRQRTPFPKGEGQLSSLLTSWPHLLF
jgi:hypothetical protein